MRAPTVRTILHEFAHTAAPTCCCLRVLLSVRTKYLEPRLSLSVLLCWYVLSILTPLAPLPVRTVQPARLLALVFALTPHTTPLPSCNRPQHPHKEISQQPQLLELRRSEPAQASAQVRLDLDPRTIHGGNVLVCSTEAFHCAGSAGENHVA